MTTKWKECQHERTERLAERINLFFEHIAPQFDPELGFVEGVYENGSGQIAQYTANNNGIMLETLYFKVNGPIVEPVEDPVAWVETNDSQQNRCLPGVTAEPQE